MSASTTTTHDKSINLSLGGFLFFLIHAGCLLAFVVGVDLQAVLLCLGLFLVRKFGITGGFHRYFSHRAYKTSRFFQFCLAFLGGMAVQKGALWWAAYHRHHHQHSDEEEDIHSNLREGFWWSHVGWILSPEYEYYDNKRVKDLTKFPELVFLDKHHYIPPIFLAVTCYLIGGWRGFVWGFLISTVILYHTTFAINSLCHMFGNQRYKTGDASRNSLWLALVTLGEGWHNNHHHYPAAARQGFYWWEIDIAWYVIKVLSWLGIVWDLKEVPEAILAAGRGKQVVAPVGVHAPVTPTPSVFAPTPMAQGE